VQKESDVSAFCYSRVKPGNLADMAILAEDPMEMDPMKLRDIEVLGTISGGVVHKTNNK